MATGRRRSWESLTPKYRARLSRGGVTKAQYQSGANLSKARGHGETPEHPREAFRKPARYRKYVEKRRKIQGPGVEEDPYERNRVLDAAFLNFDAQLGNYHKYRRATVLANVYGGTVYDVEVPGMNLAQARWTARADAEEIRSRASEQYRGNPWFYH